MHPHRSFPPGSTAAEVEKVVADRFYHFQLATLYFTVLSGSVWRTLNDLLENPECARGPGAECHLPA